MTDLTNPATAGTDLLNAIEHDLDAIDLAMTQLDQGDAADPEKTN